MTPDVIVSQGVNGAAESKRDATNSRMEDVIVLPSRTRPDGYHFVQVNVLAGCTTGCSCEADRHGQYCWARKEVDAVEGSWGFHRCTSCGSLMRLGRWHTASGPIAIWVCPHSSEHTSHEPGTDMLFRDTQPWATGSGGSWRLA